jgi:hypothetical protein
MFLLCSSVVAKAQRGHSALLFGQEALWQAKKPCSTVLEKKPCKRQPSQQEEPLFKNRPRQENALLRFMTSARGASARRA